MDGNRASLESFVYAVRDGQASSSRVGMIAPDFTGDWNRVPARTDVNVKVFRRRVLHFADWVSDRN
jgi:hypothetical protein